MENVDKERLKAISAKIKRLRIEAGYTSYEQFAVANGMERKQYWRHESGYNFMMTTFFRILDAHKMTPSEFFKDWEM